MRILTVRSAFLLALTPLAAGCGGESGPSYASALDSATTLIYADDGKALMQSTLLAVFGSQDASTPDPFLSADASGRPDPITVARRYLAHIQHVGGVTLLPGAALGADLAARADGVSLAAAACVPTQTGVDSVGTPVDSDGDGIPDDYKVDFGSACGESAGGLVFFYSGWFRIHDTESGFGAYTYTTGHLTSKVTDGSTGDNITQSVNGTERADFSADSADHTLDVTLLRTANVGSDHLSVTFDLAERSFYLPDAGSSFAPLTALPPGTLTLSLDYSAVGKGVDWENVRFTFRTAPTLHYVPGCASVLNGGAFEGLLNAKAATGFRYTWSGCAAPTLELFGTTP